MGERGLKYDDQAISVDCVVFGFDGHALRVLLVRRERTLPERGVVADMKLPGSLIADTEDLESAASRVMGELTGITDIYLRQMEVFSDPARVQGDELQWINDFYGVNLRRVLTVVFHAVVKLDARLIEYTAAKGAQWVELDSVRGLALDHNRIVVSAIGFLISRLRHEPLAFALLPRKFTIRQLQDLYQAVLGIEIDNRNFRKKILSQPYIIPLGEKQTGVWHKPAQYYRFDARIFEREHKSKFKLDFLR